MPEIWREVALAEIGKVVTGSTPSFAERDAWGHDLPFLTPTDIDETTRFAEPTRYLSSAYASRMRARVLPANAVCFVSIGSTIGKVCMTHRPTVTNQQINSVVVDSSQFDPVFVYFCLRRHAQRIAAIASGSATPIVNRSVFSAQKLPLPSLRVQHAIAEVLGALDDKIEADRNLARLAERSSIAHCMLTPEQVPVESLAEAERKQLPMESFTGRVVDHFSLPAFDAGARPERCAGTSVKSSKLLLEGPRVLVSRLNPHIPRVWHAVPEREVMALASTEFATLRPKEGVSTEELWAVCSSPDFIAALQENVTGTTGSHQRVRPEDVLRTTVQDPRGLPAMVRELVRSLVQLAAAAREESVRLAQLRDLSISHLLSGELRASDAETLAGEAV